MGVLNAKVGTEWVPISASNNVDHWNSAWGTVAMGSFKSGLASPVTLAGTFQQLTEPIVINTLGGRRYRINYQMRAINAVSATASSANFMVYDGGVPRGDLGDWYSLTITTGAVYSGPDWGAVIEGDGATHTYTIWGRAWGVNALAHWDNNCRFYIEDIGPVARLAAGAIPPGSDWSAYDARYVSVNMQAKGGTANVTFDASGIGLVTHGMGRTPTGWVGMHHATSTYICSSPTGIGATATTIPFCTFRRDTGAFLVSTTATIRWMAF